MATAAAFSSLRRRRSPSLEALLVPVDLSDGSLVKTLLSVSKDLVESFSGKKLAFQVNNSSFFIRKIELLVVLFNFLKEFRSVSSFSYTSTVCFKELYLVLYRCKILLDYCTQSSKLLLLVQNRTISGYFHDLNQDISTILDVIPIKELGLNEDVRELIELLQRQLRRKFSVDKHDEMLLRQLYSFLDEFDTGRIPNKTKLWSFFVHELGIQDSHTSRVEIELLEEQIVNHEGDIEPSTIMLKGFVSLTRYCRFLLFGFEMDEIEMGIWSQRKMSKGVLTQEIADTFLTAPKDFCCPISLEMMQDPVIVCTGQTYDRSSIIRWIDDGHSTCPKTGQMLSHTHVVPNRALRHLIMQWCLAHSLPFDQPEGADSSLEMAVPSSKAAVEADRATGNILIQQLATGSVDGQAIAAREIRLLAKTGKENRAFIAEAGAIPYLKKLLSSENPIAQENSVTAILNLSIYDKNKSRIMGEEGCLESIIDVLRCGHTSEARENAAATLFSLSAVHEYKKRIADEDGGIDALKLLLREGSPRGKKDAVTALFNLCTYTDNCVKMIESGVVTALVGGLLVEGVSEEAAGALALIVGQPLGAEAVGREERAVADLLGLMRCGTPRGKENAVTALLELCRSGGAAATERVLNAPALSGLIQTLMFTGTKRARRKAASLARAFQRRGNGALHYGGLGAGYSFAANSATDVSMPMSISAV